MTDEPETVEELAGLAAVVPGIPSELIITVPWERLRGETLNAYERFREWLENGHQRSLRASKTNGRYHMSQRWFWKPRLAAWQDESAREFDREIRRRRESTVLRSLRQTDHLQRALLKAIKAKFGAHGEKITAETFSVEELFRYVRLMAKFEQQLIDGVLQPADIQELSRPHDSHSPALGSNPDGLQVHIGPSELVAAYLEVYRTQRAPCEVTTVDENGGALQPPST